MTFRQLTLLGAVAACTAAGAPFLAPRAPALEPPPAVQGDDFDVLTRGPVHEAFAESVSFEPQPGFIVEIAPPEAIEELPPEEQPEGDNIAWIPGYWAWDDDETDYLWISGVWRNLPPGREWIPGYWNAIDGGRYQWIAGYWADTDTEEVEYIATAPPQSIDAGPNVAAPSGDHSWIPGSWVWNDSRYLWRPGYWLALRADWNWVPSRYCWTPRGYIHVSGYWDHAIAHRGVLFAPVHFHRRAHFAPDYYYTPRIVVGLGVFSSHLFVRPRTCHYYFGDYYAPRYASTGYHAAFAWHTRRHCYDPIFAHNRWVHRHDRDWQSRTISNFNYFRDHAEARPARRWATMSSLRDRQIDSGGRDRHFASTFASYTGDRATKGKFRAIDRGQREVLATRSREIRSFSRQRGQLETRRIASGGTGKKPASVREKLTRSPIFAKRNARSTAPGNPSARRELSGTGSKRGGKSSAHSIAERLQSARQATRAGSTRRESIGKTEPSSRAGTKIMKPSVARGQRPAASSPKISRSTPGRTSAGKSSPRPGEQGSKLREMLKRQATPQRAKSSASPTQRTQPQQQARKAPARQAQPQRQIRKAPTRQAQPQRQIRKAPTRQVQPQRQIRKAPTRQVQPQRQIRKAPARQAQPQRQIRKTPTRQVQPQRQIRKTPARQAQPQRQVRKTPTRQAQPQRQIRKAPARQAQRQPDRSSGRSRNGR
ncbi:YXWGXW repeat-containing protein [Luteolibacter marinus]|uniref:YXWGXW repeat-containing protein n=1 Tax=Luteolibacter marinus TaxID=2776705 RepID=UPI00186649F5|nr:YXWGXW repeat-containing protein [Luteolibacter marinus]